MDLLDILLNDCVNPSMSFKTNNLKRLGNQVNVPINKDEAGYFGRECPVEECLGYFKVTPETGMTVESTGTSFTF
jgi:hypothetical protein